MGGAYRRPAPPSHLTIESLNGGAPAPLPASPAGLGDQLLGLELHLRGPLEGHIHQELEAAEVLGEVWGRRRGSVEQPAAAGAQTALQGGADGGQEGGDGGRGDDIGGQGDGGHGGCGRGGVLVLTVAGGRVLLAPRGACRPPVRLRGDHEGGDAGLHRRGDSGVTDD